MRLLPLLLLLLVPCRAAGENFSGTYTGKDASGPVTLTLRQNEAGEVSGTLADKDTTLQLWGKIDGGQVVGISSAPTTDQHALFRVRRQATGFTFEILKLGEDDGISPDPAYQVTLTRQAQPPKTAPSKATPAKSSATTKARASTKLRTSSKRATGKAPAGTGRTYQHPTGFTLRYPRGWSVAVASGSPQLVPPRDGASKNTLEQYILLVGPTQGARSVEEPRTRQAMEAEIARMFPFLKRVGNATKIKIAIPSATDGTGLMLTWEGTTPQRQSVRARVFMVLHNRLSFSIFALAPPQRLAAHDKALREIYASIGYGQPSRDRQLAGTWSYSKSEGHSGGGFSFATQVQRELALQSNGSYVSTTASRVIGGNADVGADTGSEPTQTRGQWFAGQGLLYLLAEDASLTELAYRIEGTPGRRVLALQGPNGTQMFNEAE
ncbi:MAG: hypothetical protein M3347_02000 [Armatimonadota bacterium]|nr:hypothetical protein [Armatimonadota bacterium]